MLYLISLGLHNEKDMSIRAREIAKKCDSVYAEFYTTPMATDAEKLSHFLGNKVTELRRKDLEDRMQKILDQAKTSSVAVFVGGDALAATTHITLLQEAKKQGIPFRVIHGPSIYTAVSESGLQLYNFGKTTTVAFPSDNYAPTSCYDAILANIKMGLHTLVLLDIRAEETRYMTIRQGLEILLGIESKKGKGIITPETRIVVMCAMGSEKQVIKYDTIQNLRKDFPTPAVLIIPGKLHFMEKEYLESL